MNTFELGYRKDDAVVSVVFVETSKVNSGTDAHSNINRPMMTYTIIYRVFSLGSTLTTFFGLQ